MLSYRKKPSLQKMECEEVYVRRKGGATLRLAGGKIV